MIKNLAHILLRLGILLAFLAAPFGILYLVVRVIRLAWGN
jgi:hypothetical protein